MAVAFAQPYAEHAGGQGGQWRAAFLSSFAQAPDVRSGAELHVLAAEPGQFRDSQAGLQRDGQQRVGLFAVEERDDGPVEALGRYDEHPADECGVLGVAERGELEQRVDRRQPGVPGPGAVAALMLEVIEERRDERRAEICEVEPGGRYAGLLAGELQQEPERVPVGGDGVRAGSSLALGEERLQGGRQRGHDRVPADRSSRSAARAISSGAADRYQYVAAGLM